jgi:hypothetical protein
MLTLVTGDLHLNSVERDDYRFQFLAKLVERAKVAKVRRSIILGDLTEQKDRHRDWLVNQVVDIIERFAQLGDVIIEQGNHDYLADPNTPFFGFLNHLPRVRWIGRPHVTKPLEGLGRCLFLPHTRNYKRDWRDVDMKGHDWIFAHNTFESADGGFGRKLDGIPTNIFPKNARVVAGDVHVPQEFDCITYVGAPYLVDFGDSYEPRVLLLDDDKITSMPAAKDDPQKRLIDVPIGEGMYSNDVNEGDIIKVRIELTRKAADQWPIIRNKARKFYEKQGAIVHSIVPVLLEQKGQPLKFKQADPIGDEELVRDFGKSRGLDKRTLAAGVKLL